ncbi:MAG: DUF1549 domain-containing protein [Deltaproteobacteria bacterium]|nr:DUF1549 domain-containing protein [Deltaproteobacteria bacterium]
MRRLGNGGLVLAAALFFGAFGRPRPPREPTPQPVLPNDVSALDAAFEEEWRSAGVRTASPAAPLTKLRRLTLGLHGRTPSLEEVLSFERAPDLTRWAGTFVSDPRFAQHLASRWSVALAGTDAGPFLVFRRDLFEAWLAREIQAGTGMDEILRRVVETSGSWSDRPAVNFVTATYSGEDLDRPVLATRLVRVYLGQRIDCARCHDHPFETWTKRQFHELSAFFDETQVALPFGISDTRSATTTARVPFDEDLLPTSGSRRQRLAAWATHSRNRRFSRAIANRLFGVMFGAPLEAPVDDLNDPPPGKSSPLDVLADQLVSSDFDLRRFFVTLAMSRPFGLESQTEDAAASELFAAFPVTPLRVDQVFEAVSQARSVTRLRPTDSPTSRAVRFLQRLEFTKAYGETERELDARSVTLRETLTRLNGKLVEETAKPNPFNAVGRVQGLLDGDRTLEALFLTFLTRRPTPTEVDELSPDTESEEGLSDLAWALANAPEMSWSR